MMSLIDGSATGKLFSVNGANRAVMPALCIVMGAVDVLVGPLVFFYLLRQSFAPVGFSRHKFKYILNLRVSSNKKLLCTHKQFFHFIILFFT